MELTNILQQIMFTPLESTVVCPEDKPRKTSGLLRGGHFLDSLANRLRQTKASWKLLTGFIFLLIAVILVFPGISLAQAPIVQINSVSRNVINDDPDDSGYSIITWEADQGGNYTINRDGENKGEGFVLESGTGYVANGEKSLKILPSNLECDIMIGGEGPCTISENLDKTYTINIYVTNTTTTQETGEASENITLDTDDPDPPPSLTAEPGDEKAFLEWGPSPSGDTAGYFVYIAEVTVTTNFILGTTNPDEYDYSEVAENPSSHDVTGLNNDTEYAFAISAYDEATNESGLFAGERGEGITIAPEDAVGLGAITDEKGGCFIATAAFGSYQSGYVKFLREFRDNYLMTNNWGRKFVSGYYQSSPYLANYVSKSEALKALARLLLIPLIGLSLFLTKTTLIQKCFLLCLLFFLSIWLVRRKTALKKALIIITLSFLPIAFSSPAWADESPQSYSIELRGASYNAQDIDPSYELIYGSDKGFLFEVELGWQFLDQIGILGVDAGIGYFKQTGHGLVVPETAIDPENWEKSKEEYTFRVVPTEVSMVYRLAFFKNQLFVPFAKVGVDYYYFRESRKDGEEVLDGGKWGHHYGGGGQLLLDLFDRKHANKLDIDYGINNTYLIFEYRKATVDDFGEKEGFDFSNSTWFGGLMFEF